MSLPLALALKPLIDRVLTPPAVFLIAVAAFAALIAFRTRWTRPRAALVLGAAVLAAFALVASDPEAASKLRAPDAPALLLLLASLGAALWLAFRRISLNDALSRDGLPTLEERESESWVLAWPELIYVEFLALIAASIGLVLWSLLAPAPLEGPADPGTTPNPAKAPWYFVGLQELLAYFDPTWAGTIIPGLIIFGLAAIPYLDRNPRGNGTYTFRERPFAITVFLFGFLVLWVLPMFVGTFFRGPGWASFGPFESWTDGNVEAASTLNFSEVFYCRILGAPLPREVFVRELPGLVLAIAYFLGLPPILARTVLKRERAALGRIRFAVLTLLLLFMAAVPIKMALRWAFDIKYLVAIPERFLSL
jgi:hypothetical protein